MRKNLLSTKCYFIEKNEAHGAGFITGSKQRKFLRIGRLSDALEPSVRERLAESARGSSCCGVYFQGVWDDGVTDGVGDPGRNSDTYRAVFDFFRSLKLFPHVSVDVSAAPGEDGGERAAGTAKRLSALLKIACENGRGAYWRHGSFELSRPMDTSEVEFMEIYAASHKAVKEFAADARIGFRIEARRMNTAYDIFEDRLILSWRNSCEPDFVTLDMSEYGARHNTCAKEALYMIHDVGANVKTLYVVEHDPHRAAGEVFEEFDVLACA
jgi:hypothetical protein